MNNAKFYSVDTLTKFAAEIFTCAGVPEKDAGTCAVVLLASDIRGIESHGLSRLKMYVDRIGSGQQNPVTNPSIVRETPSTATLDGNNGMGAVVSTLAMNLAIAKAKQVGTGSVAVCNSNHFGIAGYYPLLAVKENMIGICVTNTRPSMAPTFGVQPLLGTNPIAFGAPTDEDTPFLFDAATTIIQRGKIEISNRLAKPLRKGYVIDKFGQAATNPADILVGLNNDLHSLLPLGGQDETYSGYKGYGLATIVEILSACLQNGSFMSGLTGFTSTGNKQPFAIGHFFQAISIEAFTSEAEFKKSTGDILRTLRNSNKAEYHERIFTAGEKEAEATIKSFRDGLAISSNLAEELNGLAQHFDLDDYYF